jgi:hypothetical protein
MTDKDSSKEHGPVNLGVVQGSGKKPAEDKSDAIEDHEHDDSGMTFEVVEGEIEGGKKVRRKGVYLLPNLFPTGALFSMPSWPPPMAPSSRPPSPSSSR